MTSFDLSFAKQDHFALFGLPRSFAVDRAELDRLYRDVQARVHPDKHAHMGDADRRIAMQWATQVNEAYQTLQNPLRRGRYLLELAGHDPRIETNTAMPAEFLMEQMEWREAVAEARAGGDADTLGELHQRLGKETRAQYEALAQAIDGAHDWTRAADIVRQLMFQEKLLTEIDEALEAVEA
ncbi:MAG: Fe-S protein assembly co-chaperone HscB [Sterolibacteriaceae bacterium MAG5]|nr:Fe-S protein assembly co-chaperone HscB [Candidatus Nitricoxidireducens bremensis]